MGFTMMSFITLSPHLPSCWKGSTFFRYSFSCLAVIFFFAVFAFFTVIISSFTAMMFCHLLHIGRNDTLASPQPRKHALPVARLVGQAELAVVTYVVDDHAHLILVVMVDTQPAPHHLQILGKRQQQGGPSG